MALGTNKRAGETPEELRQSARSAGRRRRRVSILLALGTIFLLSALLRLGQLGTPFDAQPAIALDPGSSPMGVAGPTAPIRAALDEVERLRAELAAREAEIAERERVVNAAQILIEERLAVLSATEDRLTALLALSDTAAETDIDRLTRVYETMEPDAAAPLFAQMEASFAAGFLSRMSPAASAALMSELDPQTAYAISVVLATRNAGAPTRNTAMDRTAETAD
jgi:flagellar motility protein MotE (MotC chaperone)